VGLAAFESENFMAASGRLLSLVKGCNRPSADSHEGELLTHRGCSLQVAVGSTLPSGDLRNRWHSFTLLSTPDRKVRSALIFI
jgi:hypothetical protein